MAPTPPTSHGLSSPIAESDVTGLVADLAAKTLKATLTTKGDIYAASAASTPARVGVGSDAQVLTADAASSAGVKWAAAGGSTPGAVIARGPFAFAFNTASINNGVTIYTPTVSDVLIDAWIEVDTAFDGTTPLADLGTFSGTNDGLFAALYGPVDLTIADAADGGAGVLFRSSVDTPTARVAAPLSGLNSSYNAVGITNIYVRVAPALFTAANPVKIVVSQTGAKGGTAVGGAAGTGKVYLLTATPI